MGYPLRFKTNIFSHRAPGGRAPALSPLEMEATFWYIRLDITRYPLMGY